MPQADVVTVSTLITCCERMNDWRRAQEVWDWMLAQVRAQGRGHCGGDVASRAAGTAAAATQPRL